MHFTVIYIAYYCTNNCTPQIQFYSFYKSFDTFHCCSTVLRMSIYKVL